MFPILNLPSYEHRITKEGNSVFIFDPVRKKKVVLTPEEWVRQNFIRYLLSEKGFPISRLALEMKIEVNGLSKRCDLVYYSIQGLPQLIVECKASHIKLSQGTFDQAARYNMTLQVPYLVITNGMQHYCARIKYESNDYQFLTEVPDASEL